MGSRERKRAERHKRKRRAVQHGPGESDSLPTEAAGAPSNPAVAEAEAESFHERVARRAEERNAAARAELEPLEAGERPGAVTIGAVVSILLALVFTVSAAIALTGTVEIRDSEPQPLPLAIVAGVLWLMAWGMWKARYWAVLGFQMVLLLVILSTALGLIQVSTLAEAAATLLLLAGSAGLFYFMIRAMARIQMPERPGS